MNISKILDSSNLYDEIRKRLKGFAKENHLQYGKCTDPTLNGIEAYYAGEDEYASNSIEVFDDTEKNIILTIHNDYKYLTVKSITELNKLLTKLKQAEEKEFSFPRYKAHIVKFAKEHDLFVGKAVDDYFPTLAGCYVNALDDPDNYDKNMIQFFDRWVNNVYYYDSKGVKYYSIKTIPELDKILKKLI